MFIERLERAARRGAEIWSESDGDPYLDRIFDFTARGLKSTRNRALRPVKRTMKRSVTAVERGLLRALSLPMVPLRRNDVIPQSVLHISYMVHIPHYATRVLRKEGWKADYLAIGKKSSAWDKSDYHFDARGDWREEFRFFWDVIARYEIIHSHFGIMLSLDGWELPILKALGRKIVVHYRGCEIRDQAKNMALHPQVNICQDCDYGGTVCRLSKPRVDLAQKYGDLFLLTTPDMKDFLPSAIHFPFFSPEIDYERWKPDAERRRRPFKIVHATNHPGIEGTKRIVEAVDRLKTRGHAIELEVLQNVGPERVLEAIRDADLTVGKMKMGYYANAQIESLFLGVPAVTWVRPDLMRPELEHSGLILTDVDHLEETLERYLTQPALLEEKRRLARASVLELHDNRRLGRWLIEMYEALKTGSPVPQIG